MSQPPPPPTDSGVPASARTGPPRRKLIDGSFLFVVGFAAASAAGCWWLNGPEVFFEALRDEGDLMLRLVPVIAGAVLLAAFVQVLVPTEVVKRWLGAESGWKGVAVASVIGAFVPGGPMASFPLMMAVIGAGAHVAASVAFLTSWSVLAIQRLIVWEIPLMGGDFALVRFLSSALLPPLAGWWAAWLYTRWPEPPAKDSGAKDPS